MIDLILDECLNEIHAGRATLADCLAKYPDQADELAPLLELGVALNHVPEVQPSLAFQQATRARLMQLPQQTIRRERLRPALALFTLPHLKFAAVALVVLVALGGFTGGAVAASSDSLPGSILYPVKRASEQVQLLLATDPASQADVHLQIANDRLNETVALSESGQDQLAQQTIDEYNTELSRTLEIITVQSNNNPTSIEKLTKGLIKQQEKLRGIKNPQAEEGILRRALSISEKALEKIAPENSATPTALPVLTTPGQPTTVTQPALLATPPSEITQPSKGKPPTSETIDASETSIKPPTSETIVAPETSVKSPPGKDKPTDEPKGKPSPKSNVPTPKK